MICKTSVRAVLFIAALSLLFSASSCGRVKDDTELYCEYHFIGECEYMGEKYSGEFYISSGEELDLREKRIDFDSPDALSHVSAEYKDGRYIVAYDGSVGADVCEFGIFDVFSVFDARGLTEKRKTDGGIRLCGGDVSVDIEITDGAVSGIRRTDGEGTVSVTIGERL